MSQQTSHIQCLCGAFHEPSSLLAATHLPIPTEMCHCNPCRQTSGSVGSTCVELSASPSEKSLANSTMYLQKGGRIEKWFCETCGTRTTDYSREKGKWFLNSGCIVPLDEMVGDLVKVVKHEFVGDTGDGGFAGLMRQIGGKDVPSYVEREEEGKEMSVEEVDGMRKSKEERENVLHAECHCGTIQFDILPPPKDVLERPQSVTRWLRSDATKYWALLCACNYCRLTFGAMSFAFNTYVMPENIIVQHRETMQRESPFDYTSYSESTGTLQESTTSLQKSFPGLKCYYSADDTRRSFCGTCGACIFFERESRPQCVNVAVGILRARSGVLAEDWLNWERDFVWFAEEAADRQLVDAYLEGWKTRLSNP